MTNQQQRRPDWLPEGHAFCPGDHEEVRFRQFAGMPGVMQNVLRCDHGEWTNQADAWTAHEQFAPAPALPGRAGREGDSQPMPIKNDEPYVQDAVIADIEARKQLGVQRYGTALQINNGRDFLLDAYEEAMDLTIYLKGAIMERDAK